MTAQHTFYAVLVLLQPMLFVELVGLIQQGQRFCSWVCALFISPGMLMMAVTFERRSLLQLADLSTLPWSLAIGDTLLIPLAAFVAADAYKKRLVVLALWTWWTALWWLCGLAVGTLFYFVLDGPVYAAVGREGALLSPTKIMHDFVVMSALWGGMFCACLPLLRRSSWHRYALLVCFIGWTALVAIDGQRNLDLTKLHPLWDAVHFRPM